MPGWVSILPPLLAIGLALLFRHVLVALFLGVWLGALLLADLSPIMSFARLLDTHLVGAMADRGHASILLFSLLLGGMLGLMTQSGGAKGLAAWASTDTRSRRRGQLTTWFLGLLVFFDDYANSLLVGASMRPVTDRLRISREKLAFIVDATAAPVASLALISSWIGVEVGYIADQFAHLGIERDAYLTFIETIPFRFYPILMLLFVFWVSFRGRDFGPMRRAEERSLVQGLVSRPGAQPASDFHDEAVPDDVEGPRDERGRSGHRRGVRRCVWYLLRRPRQGARRLGCNQACVQSSERRARARRSCGPRAPAASRRWRFPSGAVLFRSASRSMPGWEA